MTRYSCTVLYDASSCHNVEADTPEDAGNMALDAANARLCHQCSDQLDLGDPLGAIVYDADTDEEKLDTTYHAEEIARLKKRIAELEAEAAKK